MAKAKVDLPQYVGHTPDGVVQVRVPVKPEDRCRLPAPYTHKSEIKVSLQTKCEREAAKRWPQVIADALAMREAARPVPHKWAYLSPKEDETVLMTTVLETMQREMRELLAGDRTGLDPDMVRKFESFLKRDSIPMLAGEFRNLPVDPVAETIPLAGMTFAAMVDHWQVVNNGTPEETRAYHRWFRRLASTVGHDEANRVKPHDIIRHEERLRKDGLRQKTISNHLKGFRVVFRCAKEKLKIDQNPMKEIVIREGKSEERLDFTPAERNRILLNARAATNPVIKWCNLLAGFHGMRLEEIAEMDTRDVYEEDGVLVFDIRREHRLEASPNRVIKNDYSVRQQPVHTAIAAAFLGFVESVRAEHGEGPLFPALKPDQDGRLSDAAGKIVNPWLRETCQITHPMKSFHSWRHTISSMLDKIPATKGTLARKLTGHAPETEAERYHHYTLREKADGIELLPCPFAIEEAA